MTKSPAFTPAIYSAVCKAAVPFTVAIALAVPVKSAICCSNWSTYLPTLETNVLSSVLFTYSFSLPEKVGAWSGINSLVWYMSWAKLTNLLCISNPATFCYQGIYRFLYGQNLESY